MSKRIVIVEDEPDVYEVLEYNLAREGYEVRGSDHGERGLALIQKEAPDLAILDVMLPGMNGLDICRELKADPKTRSIPVIILTARNEEADVVLGLGLGADDYLTKPFRPRELVARVQAALRRQSPGASGSASGGDEEGEEGRYVVQGVVLDSSRHVVLVDDEPITLTATEFRLLRFLMSHPGRVYTREQLIDRSVGAQAVIIDRNIDVHVRGIRKKLGPYRDLLETVRGVGYRFSS